MAAVRLVILGGGNMGSAFASGVVKSGALRPAELLVIDPAPGKREALESSLGVNTAEAITTEVSSSEAVLLAVKPQSFASCAVLLNDHLRASQLVISIMAGVRLARLQALLPTAHSFVRAMPNLPAQIGMGFTGYFTDGTLNERQLELLQILVESVGAGISLSSEEMVDVCTAVSGSGPGFLFALFEAIVEAGVSLGLSRGESEKLVLSTVAGSVALWEQSGRSLEELRKGVASRGGTTEAGLAVLDREAVSEGILKAVEAAFRRAREISSNK